jgi:hypothetical protein
MACATPLIKAAATASPIWPSPLPELLARDGEEEPPEGDACADGAAWEP